MERNNGKIAIAIVAMFVVALSIVGVTYAYFVASVNKNDANKSVEVKAGILKVTYASGQTLSAEGIVPGWKSDDNMVYNSIKSVSKAADGSSHITAVPYTSLSEDDIANGTTTAKVKPIRFTVTDSSTKGETAYYALRLREVTNGLYESTLATDHDDFEVTITSVDAGFAPVTHILTNATSQNLAGVYAITTGTEAQSSTTHTFELAGHYKETGIEQKATLKNVKATVEVVGLNLIAGTHGESTARYADAVGNTYDSTFTLVTEQAAD